MENPMIPIYSYKLRPGYGSQELLIELDGKKDPDGLQRNLILILEQNGFKLHRMKDPLLNQELNFVFGSANGTVLLSRDAWEFFFLMGENHNQTDILKLDEILSQNPLFEQLIVNHSDYK